MHEGLRVGNLDMAVLYNSEQSADLEMSTLREDELMLISPAASSPGRSGSAASASRHRGTGPRSPSCR